MSIEKQERDQRKSFRCTVAFAKQDCELRIGSRLLPVKLVEESAGGFSVLVEGAASEFVDKAAQLLADDVWYNVRIIHVQEIQRSGGESEAAENATCLRLGLRRLGEAAVPGEPRISLFANSLRCSLGQWCPSGGMFMAGAVLLAITIVGVSMAHVMRSVSLQILGPSQQHDRTQPSPDATLPKPLRPQADAAPSPADQKLRNAVRRLSGAAPFALPEIVGQLKLTADQQDKIGQLIEATAQAIRNLDVQPQGGRRQEIAQRRTQLLDQARRHAIGLLTDRQRAQWRELSGVP